MPTDTPATSNPAAAAAAASSYYGASLFMRALRVALATLQRAWPALGVRAAYRLFGTPLPLKWLNRRHAPGAGWQREAWAFENASLGVYTPQAASPEAPRVLLVHGWGGHAGQMLPLAQALIALGTTPLLLEMPAHGRSPGTASNLPQFVRAIDYVAARLALEGTALKAIAAHSLGANALAYAASRGLRAERLVLLAPPASPHAFTRYFAHVFGLSERTRAAMQHRIEAREGILMPLLEPAAVGPRIAQPTLVVHDRDDRVNRFADGVAYRDAIANARLVATQALGHRRILREPSVLQQVAAFISKA
ncbi:acetoin dehydrogenase E2 subunit dihydrolipoyllysine-residue acetyltransferase [Variovorax sp. PBS-H4]|uniref:alpha/beta hydrolase n=1 Tax=Variovorax sp. PBS-H4 TaxID=434008 RepID=UPI0013162BDE|nr:alpha/beta fold hydrolase [Variovorax sp. PBS-H4]VTU17774.1 acetoin dehydrogenase E2 subunit dihydrolipoyllysine-residue acetyltransferase [Variovorax sp. PBS-H4]